MEKSKKQLNEMISLINRMENPRTGWSVLLENELNEVSCKWRDVVGPEEFYDILSQVPNGQRVTFGYVTAAKIVVPKTKVYNEPTKRWRQVDDYRTLGKNLGVEGTVVGVIKLSIYNFPWQSEEKVSNQYKQWKKTRDELGQKYGVDFGGARYKTQGMNFGDKGGVSSYNGENQELIGHTYTNLNTFGIQPISVKYYLVLENGNLQEISEDKLEKLPYKPSDSAVDKLVAAGATPDEVAPLMTMNYQRFEHSHLLFFSASADGIPTVCINNKLSEKIGGITSANPDKITDLARERYSKFME